MEVREVWCGDASSMRLSLPDKLQKEMLWRRKAPITTLFILAPSTQKVRSLKCYEQTRSHLAPILGPDTVHDLGLVRGTVLQHLQLSLGDVLFFEQSVIVVLLGGVQ